MVNAGIGKFLKEQRVEGDCPFNDGHYRTKPILTQAKKAIAGFKIREGLAVGVKVTLEEIECGIFLIVFRKQRFRASVISKGFRLQL